MAIHTQGQSLGKVPSSEEYQLDEICANNESDQACLREMLESCKMRSDPKHSLEEKEVKKTEATVARGVLLCYYID